MDGPVTYRPHTQVRPGGRVVGAGSVGAVTVFALGGWRTNGELIADVAKLGYLDGRVLDSTFGRGNFWTEWAPLELTTNDLVTDSMVTADFRHLPFADASFDTVVFDPPYRMSGRRDNSDFDDRFGLSEYRSNGEILDLLADGARECFRVTRRFLLVKCQDQVNGGRVVWQTDFLTNVLGQAGAEKVDRFDLMSRGRNGSHISRRQIHARRNHSTLLIFRKRKGKR